MNKDIFDFLEICELELVNQLCKNCKELTLEQIECIAEEYRNEVDKQLKERGMIV
ncbi:hypothetical protein [Dielma fastidiosa]|uniref:hypothetical protein n=1 Tax=Dielma fastidiosa TaxID=1034346 RepID=UPI0015FCAC37|nr:hypothetical protein [Dielma fastidiosa]